MTEIPENMDEKTLLQKIIAEELVIFVEENKEKIVKRAEKKLRTLLKSYEQRLGE